MAPPLWRGKPGCYGHYQAIAQNFLVFYNAHHLDAISQFRWDRPERFNRLNGHQ